jgi:hypothetical protein
VSPSVGRRYGSTRLNADHASERRRENVGRTWFQQERGAALSCRPFTRRALPLAGHNDDRDVPGPRILLEVLNDIPRVVSSTINLNRDHVRLRRPCPRVRVRDFSERIGFEIVRCERSAVQLQGVGARINNQREGTAGRRLPVRMTPFNGSFSPQDELTLQAVPAKIQFSDARIDALSTR